MHRLALFLTALSVGSGCTGAPVPPPPGRTSTALSTAASSEPASVAVPHPATSTVVVRAVRAASRQPERARTLRKLLAQSGGRIELPLTYQRVSLVVDQVIEGTLADPDYAKRPIGVNHLPVVLLDEAAFVAPEGLDGFEGTWRLTKLEDGTLVVSAIADTPFAPSRTAERTKLIEATRALLRAEQPDDRVAGIENLAKHHFYELVPDVLPLLDDTRAETRPQPVQDHDVRRLPRVVRQMADTQLRRMLAPLREGEPARDETRGAWTEHWREVTTRKPPALEPVVAGSPVELMRVTANQTWPDIVPIGEGRLALGVARLETPVDGYRAGIASSSVARGMPRAWVPGTTDAGFEPDGLNAAIGSRAGLLLVGARDAWHLATFGPAPAAPVPLPALARASHAAIASDDTGFAILSGVREGKDLTLTLLDGRGRAQGPGRKVATAGPPELSHHQGIHPLAIAPRTSGGWITAAESSEGISLTILDRGLAVTSTSSVSRPGGAFEPVLGVRGEGIMLAFRMHDEGEDDHLETTTFDARAVTQPISRAVGEDVQKTSGVVALPNGFALAWIEADSEVHVARWDEHGAPAGRATVHRGDVAPFSIALTEDAGALVVAFKDVARYPYALVAKRIAMTDLH